MSELDLGLKVGARRLLWSMGYSTRLDVELRGDRSPSEPLTTGSAPPNVERGKGSRRGGPRQGGIQTFTDLDVLGVFVEHGFQLSTTIVDCKSGQRDKPTSRMFWARGVADLFRADQIMLVREHDVADATRQLSNRLGITVLAAPDLVATQELYGPPVDEHGPLGLLFERESVAATLSAFNGLDRRLDSLLEYRSFDYWVYEHHRNPVQLVAHLQESAKHLDPRNPIHLALFLDLAWLYTFALVRVVAHIRGAFLHDVDRGLQEYMFGGATNLREKQETAALLRSVAPADARNLDHLPDYYNNLRELVARLLRRPTEMQTALRYAETASALMAVRERVTLRHAFAEAFNPIAAKLIADVCGFLVASTGLQSEFRIQARAWLLGEHISRPNSSKSPHTTSTTDEESSRAATQNSGPESPKRVSSPKIIADKHPETASPKPSGPTPGPTTETKLAKEMQMDLSAKQEITDDGQAPSPE